jgi:hypothetical protein
MMTFDEASPKITICFLEIQITRLARQAACFFEYFLLLFIDDLTVTFPNLMHLVKDLTFFHTITIRILVVLHLLFSMKLDNFRFTPFGFLNFSASGLWVKIGNRFNSSERAMIFGFRASNEPRSLSKYRSNARMISSRCHLGFLIGQISLSCRAISIVNFDNGLL